MSRVADRTVREAVFTATRVSCETSCDRHVDRAASWLATTSPGHAAIIATERWRPANVLLTRSGVDEDYLVVLRLEDGTAPAVFVGCGMGLDPDRCFVWRDDD